MKTIFLIVLLSSMFYGWYAEKRGNILWMVKSKRKIKKKKVDK